MVLLVLGRGKTGRLAADVARERGHSVRAIGEEENRDAAFLTGPTLARFDAVIDFTTPQTVVPNLRASLSHGARVVVGTTGWYDRLEEMRAVCEQGNAGLVYGANFSLGVQWMYRFAAELAQMAHGYQVGVSETHHTAKKDAPSGTALVLKKILETANPALEVEIASHREGDSIGTHVITARSAGELIEIKHEALSRIAFAEGAVRAAEWLAGKTGFYEFNKIYPLLP